ncbi:amino acid/amide ABC transporter ATP-binding protein 1, HAAT family [Octadecabacter temperatus]|uniref:Lipopolysaccharide export system ATP-binding protein LptB n=1 Tax=Octadecabacter temperatus TaxID=1458307 RepID=A0A0K0Y2L0_9RHOB|nr:ABC transporter ATP-binding protein [Octadecabacter temperatus]AKS45142.1 Lipopolysaccharide export system ATP-binding protein LptB [Octadecabacter temperatus]SIN87010.1 amino acid/amide ABC transporter ATP-binding protein 1, HAAT family [Octadecabacter temperatus]
MAAVNVLEANGLTKTYGGVAANTDVDFQLQKGKITALIGPNGAGKSTFVGMLSGRIPPTRGTVSFEGRDISKLPAHKRMQMGMAYTFQITSIFPGLTVYDNVALAAGRKLANDKKAHSQKVQSVLQRIGLAERGDQIAGDLSYGHQRVLEIAMGLAQDPKVFILDEPTQGLAETEVDEFIALMKSLAGETTILLIEHNMRVVTETADLVTVLDQGRLLASGTLDEIHENEAVQAAYLGITPND